MLLSLTARGIGNILVQGNVALNCMLHAPQATPRLCGMVGAMVSGQTLVENAALHAHIMFHQRPRVGMVVHHCGPATGGGNILVEGRVALIGLLHAPLTT